MSAGGWFDDIGPKGRLAKSLPEPTPIGKPPRPVTSRCCRDWSGVRARLLFGREGVPTSQHRVPRVRLCSAIRGLAYATQGGPSHLVRLVTTPVSTSGWAGAR